MRKIPKGAFNMGEGVTAVTLTKDFYACVFEVTQGQWFQVMGARPAYFNDAASWQYRPVEQIHWHDVRGGTWPGDPAGTGQPESGKFVDRLRVRTSVSTLDLPTEAQWEYACRAGKTTIFNDGDPAANVLDGNATSNMWLDRLGRYKHNGGYKNGGTVEPEQSDGSATGTAIVGSYLPNGWDLYDMHGNVWEWCLDYYVYPVPGGTDPVGGGGFISTRMIRGGCWNGDAAYCCSSSRDNLEMTAVYPSLGFRLVSTLP
jgi:formylglycine-generating enzyme required for sulfatase activity